MKFSAPFVRVLSIVLLAMLVCGCARNRGNLFNENYDEDYDSRVTVASEVIFA